MLWSMLFRFSLSLNMKYVGGIAIWVIFSAFACLTVAVLLVMEGLSAFLHTIRLHWYVEYSKDPKFSDTIKLCCNQPKIQTKRPNLEVFCQKDANVIANSGDPDQTAPLGSSLIWVCTVCQGLFVQKLRIITVIIYTEQKKKLCTF